MGDPSPREAFRDYVFPPRPSGRCDEWCAALHLVERAVAGQEFAANFRVEDFMVMAAVRRGRRPRLYLYKHAFTRRYLNVDATGTTWRYVPGRFDRPGDQGLYVRCAGLREAIDELRLWELPRTIGWPPAGLDDLEEVDDDLGDGDLDLDEDDVDLDPGDVGDASPSPESGDEDQAVAERTAATSSLTGRYVRPAMARWA